MTTEVTNTYLGYFFGIIDGGYECPEALVLAIPESHLTDLGGFIDILQVSGALAIATAGGLLVVASMR